MAGRIVSAFVAALLLPRFINLDHDEDAEDEDDDEQDNDPDVTCRLCGSLHSPLLPCRHQQGRHLHHSFHHHDGGNDDDDEYEDEYDDAQVGLYAGTACLGFFISWQVNISLAGSRPCREPEPGPGREPG